MDQETSTLGWIDYLVIGIMLLISIGIGIYYRLTGGRQKTTEEYYSANKSMNIWPVGIALMVSFMSAITLLGVSAENYIYGTQFVIINISYLIGTPIVCYGFLPVFYKLQATSAYEYLEKRFGIKTRLLASIVLSIQLILYSGIVLYAPALALEATTGLSKTTSIFIVGIVCAFYSSIGGMKAVLATDVFQAFLMFASLIIVIGTAVHDTGGFSEIWKIAKEGQRIEFDNFSLDPTVRHSWLSLLVGGTCTFLSLYGVNQIQVQRMLTVKSLKAARKTLWINWPILTALSVTTCFSGLAIYSKYHDCDPMKIKGNGFSMDMLMPLYVMDTMASFPGLPGLFIAGIISAGISTISAALNSLSAVFLEDYIKPLYLKISGNEFKPARLIILSKLLAFGLGIGCIGIAYLAQHLSGVLQISLTIFGVVGGPLLGLFTLGMLCESARQSGAITGAITALIIVSWIAFGGPRPKIHRLPSSIANCTLQISTNSTILSSSDNLDDYFYLYKISYMFYAPIGLFITVLLGWLVSNIAQRISQQKQMYIDPDLFFPFIANRIRKREQYGNDSRSITGTNFQPKYSLTDYKNKTKIIDNDIDNDCTKI